MKTSRRWGCWTAGTLQRDDEVTRLEAWLDQGYWLLLPLLLLAALAGRRGWLFCLPLLLLQPQPASAFEFEDLWLRRDQQGQRLLEAEQPAKAAERLPTGAGRRWRCMRPVTTPVLPNASPKAVRLPTTTIAATPWHATTP